MKKQNYREYNNYYSQTLQCDRVSHVCYSINNEIDVIERYEYKLVTSLLHPPMEKVKINKYFKHSNKDSWYDETGFPHNDPYMKFDWENHVYSIQGEIVLNRYKELVNVLQG